MMARILRTIATPFIVAIVGIVCLVSFCRDEVPALWREVANHATT